MSTTPAPTLADVARLVGGEAVPAAAGGAAGEVGFTRIGSIDTADAATISFVSHPRFRAALERTAAGAVIVAPALREAAAARGLAIVVHDDPYLAFAKLTQWWAAQVRRRPAPGVHASAVVEPGARIHASAHVGPLAHVATGATLAAHAVVGPHAHLGEGASVGEGTVLHARVHLGFGCTIGARGIVHAGVVIGADGFGFAPAGGRWEKIEQLGAVRIGDDVELGANTCIDRGALEDTVLDEGVKLDNLVQIGHNVHVGAHSAFAGCVGVAGSARIGRRCTAGGGAIILGHLELCDDVHVTAHTVVTRSILKPGRYSGLFPIDENAAWEKNAATLRHLHALRERVRAIEKALAVRPSETSE